MTGIFADYRESYLGGVAFGGSENIPPVPFFVQYFARSWWKFREIV